MLRKSFLPILLLLCVVCDGKRRWNYEPISVDPNTSDSNKLDIDVRIKRMPRGEFAYDGHVNFNYDVGDDTMIECTAFRSVSGREEDYTALPWGIPKQIYTKFIKDFYQDLIFKNFHSCSNLPTPDNVLPFKRDNYSFVECVVNGDGLPDIVPQGYYKIVATVTGEVEFGFVTISRITDKFMP
ncbi:uncharacterized protein LOC117785979 [Drosophila innubila]|uniref:uncharacterized protein LOC117785979 n=1 Tax=Drosophila innubila TaxID=198719 RepID=UPI00148E532A|nr:uncharacterized protein LOC117785979 [Drosophila innubila]